MFASGQLAIFALGHRRRRAAEIVQMVIGQERSAVGVLNPIKLKPGFVVKLAAIGHSVFDRREFQEVVFARTRANE